MDHFFLSADILIISFLLLAAVVSDLYRKKYFNWLFVSSFFIAFCSALLLKENPPWLPLVFSFGTALVLGVPLMLIKALGGGDVKILLAISPLFTWNALIETFVLSLIWGLILGLLIIILNKNFKQFFQNLISLFFKRTHKTSQLSLHQIPFSVALFFGWISHLSLIQKGSSFL